MLNMFINSNEYSLKINLTVIKNQFLLKKSNVIAINPTKSKISYMSYEIWD